MQLLATSFPDAGLPAHPTMLSLNKSHIENNILPGKIGVHEHKNTLYDSLNLMLASTLLITRFVRVSSRIIFSLPTFKKGRIILLADFEMKKY